MNDSRISGATIVSWSAALLAAMLAPGACSTLAEPAEEGPPVCRFCDVGERELRCRIATYYQGQFNSEIGDSAYVCLEPDATDEEKEEACRDSCEQHIAGNTIGLTCGFEEDLDPFYWVSCVPPEEPTDGSASPGFECPGWYAPHDHVSGYEERGSATAVVSVERTFIEALRSDPLSLYVCDDARYVEGHHGWVLAGLDDGDLLFALGLRNGDRNLVLQGYPADSAKPSTDPLPLDSLDGILRAVTSLERAERIRVSAERPSQPDRPWILWISLR